MSIIYKCCNSKFCADTCGETNYKAQDTMKDYTIWLKSGECICGSMEEDALLSLQDSFIKRVAGDMVMFTDGDGKIVLSLDRVEAIATNKL